MSDNVVEEGPPGDLSGAALDEFGGGSAPVGDGIAADDAGGSALGRHVGETAGGSEDFSAADGDASGSIAADDAGATAALQGGSEQGGG